MKSIRVILASFVLFVSQVTLAESLAADPRPLWSDLDDVITYAKKTMPDAVMIRAALKTDPRFTAGQVRFMFSPHFEAAPQVMDNGDTKYLGAGMMSDGTGHIFFRKFALEVGGKPRALVDVKVIEDVSLNTMHFEINVGLIDRLVVLEDVHNEIMLIFPLGVGGLDENLMGAGKRLLTPRYHGGWLDRANVIKRRADPAYFRNEPFMPITNSSGSRTPIAFHITILTDAEWAGKGPNFLLRGFESHGCMRLRQKDLHEFFQIIENSADRHVPVAIDYYVPARNELKVRDPKAGTLKEIQPYPMEVKSYMRIANLAGPGEPLRTGRDPVENLLYMERVNRAPNLGGLGNFTADSLMDMRIFEGLVNY